jgi:hypothetical protein
MKINNLEEFKLAVQNGTIKDKPYFYKRTEEQIQAQTNEIPYLINFFKDKFNVVLYPIYGTLLGMMRNNDYILHDNDIDFAYLSLKTTKKEVIQEYNYISKVLKENGLLAKYWEEGHFHCFGESKIFKFDMWISFIIDNKYSLVPLVDKDIEKDIILPFKSHIFRQHTLLIPNKPEELLNSLYDNWKIDIYGCGNYRGIKNKWKKIL